MCFQKKSFKAAFFSFSFLILFFFLLTAGVSAQESPKVQTDQNKSIAEVAKEKIAKKVEAIEEVSDEVEKVLAEKEEFKEEAQLKVREAALLQKEAELLQEEAQNSGDEALKRKALETQSEAEKLTIEAQIAKEKLELAESKASLAQEKMLQDQREIAALKKELYEIKINSVGLGEVTKWINKPLFKIGDTSVTLAGVFSGLFIFFTALVISAVIQRILMGKLSKASRLKSGAVYAIGRVVHYVIMILGAVLAAQCVGLNLGSLAVVFGFLSVGIGFGLQNITSNFISGLILLFERPIAVGDFVTVDEEFGVVKEINMRSSLIETLDNVRIIVPNSKFIESNVINWTHRSTRIRVHCPVGVAYGSDVPKVKEVLLKVAEENKEVLKNPKSQVRFLGFGDSSLDFELLVWIDEPEQQFVIRSEINFAIDAAFREAEIQIPFPQRDLHIKSSEVKF